MAAHTGIASFTDTTYAICATLPATYDASGYGSTTLTYTTIGKVESFATYGSKRSVNAFKPINGTTEYFKGSPEYGSGEIVMADVPADSGQVILKAAEASANHYSIKITYPDTETHYLDVIVSGWVMAQASEGTGMKRTATINICRAPIIVAAS